MAITERHQIHESTHSNAAPNDAPMVVKAFFGGEFRLFCGLLWTDRTGMGRSLTEGRLLSGHEGQQRQGDEPGAAGRSLEGQHGCGSQ